MRYILPARVGDANLAASANSEAIKPVNREGTTLVLRVSGTLGTAGAVKVSARPEGSSDAFGVHYLAIRNLTSDAVVAGGTGITAVGLYSMDNSGMEVRVEFTAGTGAADVNVIGAIVRK